MYLPIARSSADLDTNLSDMVVGSGTATPQIRVIPQGDIAGRQIGGALAVSDHVRLLRPHPTLQLTY